MSNSTRRELLRRIAAAALAGPLSAQAAQHVHEAVKQAAAAGSGYTGGMAWLDHAMEGAANATFLTAKPAEQTALLDKIAYRRNHAPEVAAGIHFFDWVRRMTVDAYYTSAAGIQGLGYLGNKGMTEFRVPQEAIDYALKRSGLA